MEICDRIDNDCNGRIDMNDGLKLSGTRVPLGANVGVTRIAWAPNPRVYGVGYQGNDKAGYLETLDANGSVKSGPFVFSNDVKSFDFMWDGPIFEVVWEDSTGAIALRIVGEDGFMDAPIPVTTPPTDTITFSPVLAPTASGWAVFFGVLAPNSTYSLNATMVSPLNRSASPSGLGIKLFDGLANAPSASALGGLMTTPQKNPILLGFGYSSPPVVNILTSTFSTQSSLAVVGRAPIVRTTANEFVIALQGVTNSDQPQFYIFSLSGAKKCGPAKFGTSPAVGVDSVIASPNGYLVGWTALGGKAEVQEVFGDCSLGASFTLEDSNSNRVYLAAGNQGFAAVWNGANGATYRGFGPNFCN